MSVDFSPLDIELNRLYTNLYYLISCCLALATAFVLSFRQDNVTGLIAGRQRSGLPVFTVALSVGLIAFFGLATLYGIYISDTLWYEWGYRHINATTPYFSSSEIKDAFFTNIQVFFHHIGLEEYAYFATLVASIYIGTLLLTCFKLLRNNMWLAMMFFITSFSFFAYASNGIRNGAACHCVILGLAYLLDENKWHRVLAMLLFLLAYTLHSSTYLPIMCALCAIVFKIKPRMAIVFWVLSIFVSLTFGNAVANQFVGMGFDERFDTYVLGQENLELMQAFSSTGFRWDFVLYSAMPIIFIWYLTSKRNFNDSAFNLIANTYIFANSFWIMVIRASFSNRFAYLSWFLYPLVFAYPLIRFNIWENQERRAGLILSLFACFTLFMQFVFYGA